MTDGAQLKFMAEVDVRPAINLPDLSELSVVVDDADVDDAEVEHQIQGLRERFGVLKGVDRPAQDGDFLSIDLAATVGGEAIEDVTATGMSYQIGSGALLDGLDEAVLGRSAGESATFTTTLVGGERAGEEAEVTVTVNSVKERELPELDDEFAMTASEFDTLGELRDDLRTRLEQMKKIQQGVEARDKLLEALLETIDVPLPEGVVAAEVKFRHDSLEEQLEQAGLTKERYLQNVAQSEVEFDAEVTESARMAIASEFLLDAIAARTQIEINEEDLAGHIVRRAQRSGLSPEQFASQLVENNEVPQLMGDVRRAKALAAVLEAATVTDASGRRVDLEALREDADEDSDLDNDENQPVEYVGEPEEATAASGTAQSTDETAEPASSPTA